MRRVKAVWFRFVYFMVGIRASQACIAVQRELCILPVRFLEQTSFCFDHKLKDHEIERWTGSELTPRDEGGAE